MKYHRAAYVEIIRNTPLLVQVFIVYFGIATLGIHVSANSRRLLALVVECGCLYQRDRAGRP